MKLAVWLDTTFNCSSATLWNPVPLSIVALEPEVPSNSTTFASFPTKLTKYSVAIFAPSTLSDAIEQSTSTPLTARSREITFIPFAIASFTAGATASESTGFTIKILIFFEIKSSISLVCFAASSPASTTIKSLPSSFALSLAPWLKVTKNGLFNVDTENPILPFPTTAPSEPALDSSPSILHPTNENASIADDTRVTIFLSFIIMPPRVRLFLKFL